MDYVKAVKKIFAILIILIVLVVLLLIFQFTNVAFNVWDRLVETPKPFLIFYFIGIVIIATAGIILIYKIWRLGKQKPDLSRQDKIPTIETIQAKLKKAEKLGFDVDQFTDYINEVQTVEIRDFQIAFFGQISTGKSALIQSILPQAELEISSIGGSTEHIDYYNYTLPEGVHLVLIDTPGINQVFADAQLESEVSIAIRKVHMICYVVDKDLSDTDYRAIKKLFAYNKPLILVLNKENRYSEADKQLLLNRFESLLPRETPIVSVASDYYDVLKIIKENGITETEKRLCKGNIKPLLSEFSQLEFQKNSLNQKQRQAIIQLAGDLLDENLATFRNQKALTLVKGYSRKAMLGGIATVGPGTDVLVQGYLAMDMLKSLCKLYDVPAKEIDMQTLIQSATGKLKTQMTVILALVGNVCKAFPGVGTVIGGASHAVAYGLIFESLGNAVVFALNQQDTALSSDMILSKFEEELHHDLEKRAVEMVKKLVIK